MGHGPKLRGLRLGRTDGDWGNSLKLRVQQGDTEEGYHCNLSRSCLESGERLSNLAFQLYMPRA